MQAKRLDQGLPEPVLDLVGIVPVPDVQVVAIFVIVLPLVLPIVLLLLRRLRHVEVLMEVVAHVLPERDPVGPSSRVSVIPRSVQRGAGV